MDIIQGIISNKAITIPALTWFISQIFKVIGRALTQKEFDFSRLFGSGGMPSAHSSFIVCLSTVIGKNEGWDSHLFGISIAVALIIMYDAAGIRRAAGNQAKVINSLITAQNKLNAGKELKELLGHSPFEVVVGALLGFIMGMLLG